MSRRTKTTLVVCAAAIAVIGILTLIHCISFLIDRIDCQKMLRAAGAATLLYRQDHTNELPAGVTDLDILPQGFLNACPGVRKQSREHNQPTNDYVFVDWRKILGNTSVPNSCPILYDSRLANHRGAGINVLLVNGAVFWDPHATWLKEFSNKHPGYKIDLPKQ